MQRNHEVAIIAIFVTKTETRTKIIIIRFTRIFKLKKNEN